jgi:4-hydroxy-3-methylbut-2-enyl diphosphate reductase
MATQPDRPDIVAATSLEARAIRRHARDAHVVLSGIGLSRLHASSLGRTAISCGLAGGLRADLPTGTVLIPSLVTTTDGISITCDPDWTLRLRRAARELGCVSIDAPLLTSATLINGADRAAWASRGFAGVDMESARIMVESLAVVRVILDTPQNELSTDWLNPARAILNPRNWKEALWLSREAPKCADLAGRLIAAALRRR